MSDDNWAAKPLPVPQISRNHHGGNNRARRVDQPRPKCANPACDKPVSAANRLYHSHECRRAASVRRQRDESKWTTSKCGWCGIEFEHRASSHRQFHNQACARRGLKVHQNIKTIDDQTEHVIVLQSSYEALFWGLAKISKVRIERFDERFLIPWDKSNDLSNYDPDFWLPQYEVAVETKGVPRANMHAQWAAYRATGRLLVVLFKEDLRKLSGENFSESIQSLIAQERNR
jgi:hypothetical protein